MCRFFSLKYQTGYLYYAVYAATHTCTKQTKVVNSVQLLGGSGGVVSFLDFCPASLTSIGYFYFRWVLSSQWKAVTVNLRICEFYTANFKDILEARSQNVFGNTQ